MYSFCYGRLGVEHQGPGGRRVGRPPANFSEVAMYRQHSKSAARPARRVTGLRLSVGDLPACREETARCDRMRLLSEDVLDVFLLDEQSVEPEPEYGDFWGVPDDRGPGTTEGIWP